jgi:hypothetical protein
VANEDLIGDTDAEPGSGGSNSPNNAGGLLGAVSKAADGQTDASAAEIEQVKLMVQDYNAAREFDKRQREQYARDRRYAAGTSDPSWASDANLIGSFIDILVSFLYAQNPDVGVAAARHVGDQPDKNSTNLAHTLELVVSHLWRRGALKKAARKQVRSSLSVGVGWLKALMYSAKMPQPQTEKKVQDKEDQLREIEVRKELIEDGEIDDVEAEELSIKDEVAGLKKDMELKKKVGMTIDLVRAEDMQVSLDVADTDDYLDAEWNSNDMYIKRVDALTRFERLDEEDLKSATSYYQKQSANQDRGDPIDADGGETMQEGQFSKVQPGNIGATMSGGRPVEFVKVVEVWHKGESLIKTFIEGVNKWAVEPYTPPLASSRFYPYFRLAFFEVDGQRHPQSLSWRLHKLQDEYSGCRSNQRQTRERSVPGVLFQAGELGPEEAKKLQDAANQEYIGLNPSSGASVPLANLFASKPVSSAPPGTYDTTPIRADMESISGVQEAMQQSMQRGPSRKTATEANIENTGFQSRTSTDRDTLEEMLTELAIYTSELGVQEMELDVVKRIAGPQAYWLHGMDVEDLLTMVEVDIAAGTTGSPNKAAEKQAWSMILPLLEKSIMQIRQVQGGDAALALALTNVLKETLRRIDDRLDVADFLAQGDPPPPPPLPPPPPPSISISLKGDLPSDDIIAIGAKAAGTVNPVPGPGLPGEPGKPPIPGAHHTMHTLAPGGGNAPPPAAPPTTQPHGTPGGAVIPQQ